MIPHSTVYSHILFSTFSVENNVKSRKQDYVMYTQYHNSLHCCLTSAQTMISRVVTAVLFHIQFNPRYFRHLNQATISKALEMVNITYIMKAKVSSPAVNLPGFLQLFHIVFTPIMLTEEISPTSAMRPEKYINFINKSYFSNYAREIH